MAILKSKALELEELRHAEADACYEQLEQWAAQSGAVLNVPVTRQSKRCVRRVKRVKRYNIVLEPLKTETIHEPIKAFGYSNDLRITGKRHTRWSEL